MEIIYFYPEEEASGYVCAARKRWFREASLGLRDLGACGEEMRVQGCAVPAFYYRKKAWPPGKLSEVMELAFAVADGADDTFLHPRIAAMLTADYAKRWRPDDETVERLAAFLTARYAAGKALRCGEAAVLLGAAEEAERQLEMTWRLLQPYLPKINRLAVFCEEPPDAEAQETLEECLDDYYYEYGLVPQIEAYEETKEGLRCGRTRCRGLILDYGGRFCCPRIMPDSEAVYIDIASAEDKESRLHRRTPQIPYVSPLKYLDTMVKNSYDRLVN